MLIHIAARLLQLFAYCTVSLVKQLPAWFISSPPDKETKHWLIMPNHVSTLPGSSSATKVIRIPLDQLNRCACQRTIQKKHRPLAFYLTYVLTFYLAFYLAYILAVCLAYFLTLCMAFYLASYVTFFLAFYLAFILAFYLSFYLAYILTSILRSSGAHWAREVPG